MKHLGENIVGKSYDLGFGIGLLDTTQNTGNKGKNR